MRLQLLLSLLAFTACTTDSASPHEGAPMSAADVPYDNAGTALVSSNVQDAIDDLAAIAASHDQDLDARVISCRYESSELALSILTQIAVTPHTFTAGECGGVVPDQSYVGAVSSLRLCNPIMSMEIRNAGQADGPGIVVRSNAACSGPAVFAATFYKAR